LFVCAALISLFVANAPAKVKQAAHYGDNDTPVPGSSGAVREVIELILKAKGIWPRFWPNTKRRKEATL
jgi:3-deoxy-D-manno-octulosonate 8-phosphate phosphatase KdsC-like HAD superfamily phosphatase